MPDEPKQKVKKDEKVVILHTQVGVFLKGQVVNAGNFPELSRLLTIGAVRNAMPHECNLETVDLDVARNDKGMSDAEQQRKIDDLRSVIDEKDREIQMLKGIQSQMAATNSQERVNDLMKKIREQEVIVTELQAKLAEANKTIESLKKGE